MKNTIVKISRWLATDKIRQLFIRIVQEFVATCKVFAASLMIIKLFTCWISFQELEINHNIYSELLNETPELTIHPVLKHNYKVATPASIELQKRLDAKNPFKSKGPMHSTRNDKKPVKAKKLFKPRLIAKPEDHIQIQSVKTLDTIDIKEMLKKHLSDSMVKKLRSDKIKVKKTDSIK